MTERTIYSNPEGLTFPTHEQTKGKIMVELNSKLNIEAALKYGIATGTKVYITDKGPRIETLAEHRNDAPYAFVCINGYSNRLQYSSKHVNGFYSVEDQQWLMSLGAEPDDRIHQIPHLIEALKQNPSRCEGLGLLL